MCENFTTLFQLSCLAYVYVSNKISTLQTWGDLGVNCLFLLVASHRLTQLLLQFNIKNIKFNIFLNSVTENFLNVQHYQCGTCSDHSHKSIQRRVEMAKPITANRPPAIQDIYPQWCLQKARSISKEQIPPARRLLPSVTIQQTGARLHAPPDSHHQATRLQNS